MKKGHEQVEKTLEMKNRRNAIEGLLCYVCTIGSFGHQSSNASGSREKKNGVGMALDVATLPLILYRKVYNH